MAVAQRLSAKGPPATKNVVRQCKLIMFTSKQSKDNGQQTTCNSQQTTGNGQQDIIQSKSVNKQQNCCLPLCVKSIIKCQRFGGPHAKVG